MIEHNIVDDEIELRKIFRMEPETDGPEEENLYFQPFQITEFIDMETWNRIKDFEKNNPETVKKWKKEDEERQKDWEQCKSLGLHNKHKIEEKSERQILIEKMLRWCIFNKKTPFVRSLYNFYTDKKYLTDKQLNSLRNIYINSGGIFEK